MAEWFKAVVSKTTEVNSSEGSNPSQSAWILRYGVMVSTRDFGSLSSGSSPDISTILIWRKELTSNSLMFVNHSSKVNLRWVPTSGLV